MGESGSRTAGYVVGVGLAAPLLLLGLVFAGWLGPVGVGVAALVTGLGAALAWAARRRADRHQQI